MDLCEEPRDGDSVSKLTGKDTTLTFEGLRRNHLRLAFFPWNQWRALLRKPRRWADRNVTGMKLFRKSRLRWVWCCLFVMSRRQVQAFIFCLVMLLLVKHLYHVGIHRVPPAYKVVQARVCGRTLASRAVERLTTWKRACNTGRLRANDQGNILNHFYSDRDKSFLFCSVPQVSDTFWKRMIRFLNNASHSIQGTFLDIPKWQTYYVPRSDIRETPDRTIRFLFGEDPWVRLWNVWIEKFFLMGYWFKDFGFNKKGSTRTPKCHPDVTFLDFLSIIAQQKYFHHPAALDPYWMPQVHVCDICWLQPMYVGKMETFEEDTQCLLRMSNLTWVLGKESSYNKAHSGFKLSISPLHKRELYYRTMHSLVMENFARWHSNPVARECISLKDLMKRLWQAFQYRGYIPKHLNMSKPLLNKKEILPEDLLKECVRGFFQWPGSNIRARQKKRQLESRLQVVRAYEQVPFDTLQQLEMLYYSDFTTLGYNPRPADIFPDSDSQN